MITQKYGDLELAFTMKQSEWGRTWTGTDKLTASFRLPFSDGWWALTMTPYTDAYIRDDGGVAVHYQGGLLARVPSGSDLLKPPVKFEVLGTFQGEGAGFKQVYLRPVPPPGYRALGDVFCSEGGEKGLLTKIACVKETYNNHPYVRRGEVAEKALLDNVWAVVNPSYPLDDEDLHMYVPTGAFTYAPNGRPAPNDVSYVLDVPSVVEKGPDPAIPHLDSYDQPPAQTKIATDRIVTVPYFMVQDKDRDAAWKVENSPFYKVMRKRYFSLALYRDNREGSTVAPESKMIESGVTKEQSEAFSQATGIQVGVSVGVEASAEPFGLGVKATATASVNMSLETGYERRYSVTTLQTVTYTHGLDVAPKHSGALWSETHTLVPIRHDGTDLGSNGHLSFDTVLYYTDQYPAPVGGDTPRVEYYESADDGRRLPEDQWVGVPYAAPGTPAPDTESDEQDAH
ncbi:hypothetical protein GCM10009639_45260 [Kitasatospora putterlickiae]|uniref:Insecticidal crystal toxin domain-containing protein n=1 Tax=Kitasatospora putterlickiae TaxID=221725 RepID=A0ABP4IYN7_9ACTN